MSFFVIWGTNFFHQFCVNQVNLPWHPGVVDAACCSKMQAQEGVLAHRLFNFYYFPFRCRRGSMGLSILCLACPVANWACVCLDEFSLPCWDVCLWTVAWEGETEWMGSVFCCGSYLLPELSTCGFDVGLQQLIAHQSLLTWGSSNYYSHSVAFIIIIFLPTNSFIFLIWWLLQGFFFYIKLQC